MIEIRLLFSDDRPTGFVCSGHALFAEEGSDIVCSAVSALTINTINSIREFTTDEAAVEQEEDGGYLSLLLRGEISDRSRVLLDSLFLGLSMIEETYGEEYLRIEEYHQVSEEI